MLLIKMYLGPEEVMSRFPKLREQLTRRIKEKVRYYFRHNQLEKLIQEEVVVAFSGIIEVGAATPRIVIEIVPLLSSGIGYEQLHGLKELVARAISVHGCTEGAVITCYILKSRSTKFEGRF